MIKATLKPSWFGLMPETSFSARDSEMPVPADRHSRREDSR